MFNNLNRDAALNSTRQTCRPFSQFLNNCYQSESRLFMGRSKEFIWSEEGATQGDPVAMDMVAVATSLQLNASIAEYEPQLAYCAYTKGLPHRWKYSPKCFLFISATGKHNQRAADTKTFWQRGIKSRERFIFTTSTLWRCGNSKSS